MNINQYVGQKAIDTLLLHEAILEEDLGEIEILLERYSWDMKRKNVELCALDMNTIVTEYEKNLGYKMVMWWLIRHLHIN